MLARAEEPGPAGVRASVVAEKRGTTAWSQGTQESGTVKDRPNELSNEPALVNRGRATATGSKQAGEARARWAWVERGVWTERMLVALETGVKGGKWYALMDKVSDEGSLWTGYLRVSANGGSAGVDGQTTQQFGRNAQAEIQRLREELRAGTYQPQPVRRCWIPKPGSTEKRGLGIPGVRDRVVQASLKGVIEPILEKEFAEHSYGFRPGRGAFDALDRVERLLNEGFTWVVDVDFKSYFDTIPHERLMALVAARISDGRVLELIRAFLKAGVMEGMQGWVPTKQGTPQGGVISPLLANLYLNPLDHGIAQAGWQMTRYADDFVIQCRSQAEAEAAMAAVVAWAKENGLTVHPQKSRIVDATQAGGFDFLGYHFERGLKWPREKSLAKVKAAIRQRTRRLAGASLESIITGLNRMLKGWHAYFYRSVSYALKQIDQMVRRRLRRILLQHHKKRGNGMGLANQRWPIAYFEVRGLFRLQTAGRTRHQSRQGTH